MVIIKKIMILNFLVILLLAAIANALTSINQSSIQPAAESYNADYTLIAGKAVVEINIELKEKTGQFTWSIPKDAVAVEAKMDLKELNFNIEEFEDHKEIKIEQKELFGKIVIKYITESVLEKTSDIFFILDVSEIPGRRTISVTLPESATLKYSLNSPQTSVIPKTENIRTDGKSIIINWNEEELTKGEALLIIFKEQKKINFLTYLAFGALLLVLILIGYYFTYSYSKKRKQKKQTLEKVEISETKDVTEIGGTEKEPTSASDLTRNLFEEEKTIVETLLQAEGHELWQKQLQLKSGLSKVRLSRKLRNLEQKGLIEKIPYGNTNKIRLVTEKKAENKENDEKTDKTDTEKAPVKKEEKFYTKL